MAEPTDLVGDIFDNVDDFQDESSSGDKTREDILENAEELNTNVGPPRREGTGINFKSTPTRFVGGRSGEIKALESSTDPRDQARLAELKSQVEAEAKQEEEYKKTPYEQLGFFDTRGSRAALSDVIDNIFGGNQFTAQELLERLDEVPGFVGDLGNVLNPDLAKEDLFTPPTQEQIQAWQDAENSAVGVVSTEGVKIPFAAAQYLWEGNLSLIEWAGDFLKQQVIDEDPSQDVFSDQYEWAKWKIGLAAEPETAAGKLISHIVGFVGSMRQWGRAGNRILKTASGVNRAGEVVGTGIPLIKGQARTVQQFLNPTQAQWKLLANPGSQKGLSLWATKWLPTTKGQWGLMGRAGVKGVLEGIPSDVVMLLRDPTEGNLSNIFKQYAPDLFPSYLQGLAIDEDDSVYDAAWKTVLDGAIFGGALDAVGMMAVGAKSLRRALNNGEPIGEAASKARRALLEYGKNTSRVNLTRVQGLSDLNVPIDDSVKSDFNAFFNGDLNEADIYGATEALRLAPIEDQLKWLDEVKLPELAIEGRGRDYAESLLSLDAQFTRNVEKADSGVTLNRAVKFIDLRNGTRIRFDFTRNLNPLRTDPLYERTIARSGLNTMKLNGIAEADKPIIEISFDPSIKGAKVEQNAKELIDGFHSIIREEVAPGTIIANEPLDDFTAQLLSKSNLSPAQIRRAKKRKEILRTKVGKIFNKEFWEGGPWARRTANQLAIDTKEEGWQQALLNRIVSRLDERIGFKSDNPLKGRSINDPSVKNDPWSLLDGTDQEDFLADAQTRGKVKGGPTDNIRQSIYSRIGFGQTDNSIQYAVKRLTPTANGKWLAPLTFDKASVFDTTVRNTQEIIDALRRNTDSLTEAWLLIREQGNLKRISEVEKILGNLEKKIPVYWDDLAHAFNEYFLTGTRRLADNFNQAIYTDIKRLFDNEDGFYGFTRQPFHGGNAIQGHSVAIDGAKLNVPDGVLTEKQARTFINKHRHALSRQDTFIGGWRESNGSVTIEIARVVPDETEAKILGLAFDQKSIFDNSKKIETATYGTDELAKTKGQHTTNSLWNAAETRVLNPTDALIQSIKKNDAISGVRSALQPSVTDAQLAKIAKSAGKEGSEVIERYVRSNLVDMSTLSSVSRKTPLEILEGAMKNISDILDIPTGKIDLENIPTMKVGDDTLLTQEGIVVVRHLLAEMGSRIFTEAGNVVNNGLNGADNLKNVEMLVDQLKTLMVVHKTSANAYSRFLNTYRLPIAGEVTAPFVRSLDDIDKDLKKGADVLDQMVKRLNEGDADAKREAMNIAKALLLGGDDPNLQKKLWRYMAEIMTGHGIKWFYNNLLSSPATQVVNIFSNVVNIGYRGIAAAIGGDTDVYNQAIAGYSQFDDIMRASWEMTWRTVQNGGNALNDGGKALTMNGEVDAKMKLLQQAAMGPGSTDSFKRAVGTMDWVKRLVDFPLFSWPTAAMTTSDEFFKTMVARMEFQGRMMEQAQMLAKGTDKPTDELYKNLIKEQLEFNFDPKSGVILNDELLDIAKSVTFQSDLEGSAARFAAWIETQPVMRIFFPFVKAGHNISVYTASHVPLLNRSLEEYKRVMDTGSPYEQAIWRGREAVGRYVLMSAGFAAHSGLITGNGPADPEQNRIWQMSHQPRSINLGTYIDENGNKKTRWLDYSRIEPIGQLLAATADIVEFVRNGDLSEDYGEYFAGQLTYIIASNFTKKSYLQGIVPLGKLFTAGNQGIGALSTVAADTVNNFLPSPGMRRMIQQSMTPYMMEYETSWERLVSNATMGLGGKRFPKFDWLTGEPIDNPSHGIWAALPLKYSERGSSVVHDALEDIGFNSTTILREMENIKLTDEHRSTLARLMGESGLYQELEKWVTLPDFWDAVQDFREKRNAGFRVRKENQRFYRQIVRIIARYRDDAKNKLIEMFPELRGEINNYRSRNSSTVTADDLQRLSNF